MSLMVTPTATMLYWLATAARDARGDSPFEEVADRAGVSVGSLRAFEKGHSWPQANRLDRVLVAYAEVGGLSDVRELWRRAIVLWELHGADPDYPGEDHKPR